jgi:hypothetical protein
MRMIRVVPAALPLTAIPRPVPRQPGRGTTMRGTGVTRGGRPRARERTTREAEPS